MNDIAVKVENLSKRYRIGPMCIAQQLLWVYSTAVH